jgi:hypothetical protein
LISEACLARISKIGNYDFNGTVFVNIGIHIQGAGRGQTILRKVGPERYMFRFYIYNNAPSAFSGIKLIDPEGPFTEYDISKASIGVEFAYGCWDFKVYNCEFEGFGSAGVITREYGGDSSIITCWQTRGVIYNNRFIDCYMPGLGYGVNVQGGRDKSWNRTLELGTDWATFIEDNYFSQCRHAIASADGASYVFRYNIIENNHRSHGIDSHGWIDGIRGTRQYEIYNNTVTDSVDEPDGIGIRGGDGVIYNNNLNVSGYPIFLTQDSSTTCIEGNGWPCKDQIRELYIWNNTHYGTQISDVHLTKDNIELILQKNRDYFLFEPGAYIPYVYPHPLRWKKRLYTVNHRDMILNEKKDLKY